MTTTTINGVTIRNQILSCLPPHELERISLCLIKARFVRNQIFIDYDQSADDMLFVEAGIASVNGEPVDGAPGMQAAMIGWEGVIGDLSAIDPRHAASVQVVAYLPGIALRLPGDKVKQVMEESPALRDACAHFAQSLVAQVIQTAAYSARRSLTERCARWLLMTRERIDGDEVRVTHEALSVMLGIRRSGIAFTTAALQQSGLIQTGRGRFIILDRAGLNQVAQGAALPMRPYPKGAHPRRRVQHDGSAK